MLDIYTVTVPLFTKMLGGLKTVLQKAEEYAKENNLSEESLLNDALISDMFPLKRQVQIASDNAKGAVARLSGTQAPSYEDTEETFAELYARIDKTIEYLKTFNESSFEGALQRQVTLPYFPGKYMTGEEYLIGHAIPNFHFHVVTAYGIVRKNGVPLGKALYINGLPLKDL